MGRDFQGYDKWPLKRRLPLIFGYHLGNTFYSTKTIQVVYHCNVMFGVGNFHTGPEQAWLMRDLFHDSCQ